MIWLPGMLSQGGGSKYAPTFADNDWSSIIEACKAKEVPDHWIVGDNKSLTIDGKEYQIDIIGKNHDTYSAGGIAPLTFQLHGFYGNYRIHSAKDNTVGWTNCEMRATRLPSIKNLFPSDVSASIALIQKKTSAGNQSTNIVTTSDALFLLSEIEVFGSIKNSASGEGSQYDYYKVSGRTEKGSAYWFLRSPNVTNTTGFCAVNNLGTAAGSVANMARGLAFAFCF